jgi:DNA end-binding protein Ku
MASRSVWKGFIRFSLVSIPVKAYTATVTGGGGISLNQLHKGCNSRVKYQKVCPIHGELKADEIVSGYEFADGQYVTIDPSELEKLRTPQDRAIDIAAFVKPDMLDATYYNGKTYYLLPDGPVGGKPYTLLLRVMEEEGRYAFAQVVFSGREQIVLLRPHEGLLAMTMLSYAAEIKKTDEFQPEVPKVEVSPEELKLAKSLTQAMEDDAFDFAKFTDKYTENLTKLIQAKVEGKEIVDAPQQDAPQVINLMEALQRSVAEAEKASGKPPKLVAPSTARGQRAARKRKTS